MAEILKSKALVLSIAGSDSSGNAGMAADMRSVHAMGAHALTVITANTAQRSDYFSAINAVEPEIFESQLESTLPMQPQAIKIGLLCDQQQILSVVAKIEALEKARITTRNIRQTQQNDALESNPLPVIYDPVLSSSSGEQFNADTFINCALETLIPLCALVTPNIPEAEQLLKRELKTHADVQDAAYDLAHITGCNAVYIKGGHSFGDLAQDYFYSEEKQFWLSSKRINVKNTRGTGCVFSACVASAVALGYAVYDAVVIAKMAINQGIRQSYEVAGLAGPLHVSHFPNDEVDLPALSQTAAINVDDDHFSKCNDPQRLGLYPVVDRAVWLERLLPLGVTTAQIRIKDLQGEALEEELDQAIAVARKFNCRLFINDYWQLAIKLGAYGVHLGQEDLDLADISAIKASGLRLGISTHCHYEVARAHAYKPSYIAIGPVYSTTTKIMPWVPHGPAGFGYWRSVLSYPLVAIGGLNESRIKALLSTGADSVAMITAITEAEDPENITTKLLELVNES